MMIPYGRQDITPSDIEAVTAVLQSDFLTQGPAVPRFEAQVMAQCGALYAVAVSNATAALHMACLALDLGPGDHLWTSPNTFVASANCALYCGATVDFVDIDLRTGNMCPAALEAKLHSAQAQGTLPKVLVPVHFAGQACEMQAIHALSQKYGFRLIEDASHAIGGTYQGEPIGNGRYSDITVFSFHPVKIITTGEGGMALTNDGTLAARLALLRSHGITRNPAEMTRPPEGPWDYQQIALGYNFRMTDLQAALGCSQMARLQDYVARRHALAQRYGQLLKDLPLTLPWQHPQAHSAYHLYVVRLQTAHSPLDHRALFEALRERSIGVNLHYIPVHTQPWYQNMGFRVGDFPEAERHHREAISLPLFPSMTEAQQDDVVHALRGLLRP